MNVSAHHHLVSLLLMLVESMSICTQRMSNNLKVLSCIGRVSSLSMSWGLRVCFRRVASEATCPNKPSRRFEPSGAMSQKENVSAVVCQPQFLLSRCEA